MNTTINKTYVRQSFRSEHNAVEFAVFLFCLQKLNPSVTVPSISRLHRLAKMLLPGLVIEQGRTYSVLGGRSQRWDGHRSRLRIIGGVHPLVRQARSRTQD